MKKSITIMALIFCATVISATRRVEMVPYGNMDTWTVRYIKESALLGGQTKILHTLGPNDTIRKNIAYEPIAGNPWASSEAYAEVIVQAGADGSVCPEKRGHGYCCRLTCHMTHVTIGDIYAIVAGTIYTGTKIEPVGIIGKWKPYTVVNFGVPFTKHPVAIRLDYKAQISDSNYITNTRHNKPERVDGHHDCAEIFAFLQYRWEDPETGEIFARRVATGCEHVCSSIPEWINGHEVPIRWGNITNDPDFQEYEGLNYTKMMALNSKGKMMEIQEVGWSLDEPTHIILMMSAGCAGAFRAHEGNTLWVDNVCLVYED